MAFNERGVWPMNRLVYIGIGAAAGLAFGGAVSSASPLTHTAQTVQTPRSCLQAIRDERRAISDAAASSSAYSRLVIPAYKAGAAAAPIRPVTARMQLGTAYLNEATAMVDHAIPQVAACLLHRSGGKP